MSIVLIIKHRGDQSKRFTRVARFSHDNRLKKMIIFVLTIFAALLIGEGEFGVLFVNEGVIETHQF